MNVNFEQLGLEDLPGYIPGLQPVSDSGRIGRIELVNGRARQIVIMKEGELEWYKTTLAPALIKIFSEFLPDSMVGKIFSPEDSSSAAEHAATFILAFTDPSVDIVNNYEQLETLGDVIIGERVVSYFLLNDKSMSPDDLSKAKSHFASNEIQSDIADKTGLKDLLRTDKTISENDFIGSDVYEALYGALYTVGNKIVYGMGDILCNEMFNYFFTNYKGSQAKTIDRGVITRVNQLFEKLEGQKSELGVSYIKTEVNKNGVTYYIGKLNFTKNQIDYLMKNKLLLKYPPGDRNPDGSITIGRGESKDSSNTKAMAYTQAEQYFNSIGVTAETIGKLKKEIDEKIIGAELVNKVKAILRNNGFIDYEFVKLTKHTTKSLQTLSLVGITQDGGREIIFNYSSNNVNTPLSKKMMFEAYLASNS